MMEIKARRFGFGYVRPMEPIAFFAAAASLLATPGPTNTLLAASGASAGVRRSLPLLAAELAGYGLAIGLLRFVLGPLVTMAPAFGVAMGLAVTFYLLHVAVAFWRHDATERSGAGPVTFRRVFITTLLNPKAIIFTFTLLPQGTDVFGLSPWLALLAAQISIIGAGWIFLGATINQGLGGAARAKAGYRFSACVLVVIASVVGAHSLGLA
jgi:threonine/homoserine/homoserine lactone efflux protein